MLIVHALLNSHISSAINAECMNQPSLKGDKLLCLMVGTLKD